MFHISQLKGFKGCAYEGQPLPPQLSEDLELLVEPEAVLKVHDNVNKPGKPLELLKWRDLPEWKATWDI